MELCDFLPVAIPKCASLAFTFLSRKSLYVANSSILRHTHFAPEVCNYLTTFAAGGTHLRMLAKTLIAIPRGFTRFSIQYPSFHLVGGPYIISCGGAFNGILMTCHDPTLVVISHPNVTQYKCTNSNSATAIPSISDWSMHAVPCTHCSVSIHRLAQLPVPCIAFSQFLCF